MPAVPEPLVRALIDAEAAKSKALYAHASSPTNDSLETLAWAAVNYAIPTNGSLKTLVQAEVDYAMALAAVEAAMKGGEP